MEADTYIYRETSGESVKVNTIKVQKISTSYRISFENTVTETDANYDTVSLDYKDAARGIEVKGTRLGTKVYISGTQNGNKINKTFEVGNKPWYQSLQFGLGAFSVSNKNHIVFWLVRPDTLELHEMEAKKESIETITVMNVNKRAQKIHVNLTGIAALFWGADYWFSPSIIIMFMYKGNHGPGTPDDIIELKTYTED